MKTTSETAFEDFLVRNSLDFEKIKEDSTRRPDYLVRVADLKLIFEIKELRGDKNLSSRILGDHVRRKINAAKKQIQHGAGQGVPSILLIFSNIDPLVPCGLEDFDFITAMYGEYTLRIDKATTKQIGQPFFGRNALLREEVNTSFSAVGRLHPKRGVTLFENAFAEVKIPYDQLPSCFEVKRVVITG